MGVPGSEGAEQGVEALGVAHRGDADVIPLHHDDLAAVHRKG